MSNFKLPCFYYPTTATIIDDDQIFLENLTANLSNRIPYQLFDSPQKALASLLAQQNAAPTAQDFLHALADPSDDSSQHGKYAVNVILSDIHNKLYNRERFTIPSVIVVDHDMPGMNGIEFCKKLNDYPIKKIMLTGVADHKIAINAFNEGIVHKFIMKDDPNVFEIIDQAILEMQQSYFSGLSELIIRNIAATTFSYLEEKKFVNFFITLIKENSIVEFYLIDPIGSFLLINTDGELLWLIVKSDQEILNDCQIAIDQNASSKTINALTERKKLLFLFSEEDFKQPVEKWPSYLHPAHAVENIPGCFYALIQGENAYKVAGICKDKVFSYNNYLNTQI